jgi:hypothetical protein
MFDWSNIADIFLVRLLTLHAVVSLLDRDIELTPVDNISFIIYRRN